MTEGGDDVGQDIEFAVENARSFKSSGYLPIRPLTFLVGENSSGKTSYFALFYQSMKYFSGMVTPFSDFFDLGSIDDIIHNPKKGEKRQPFYGVSFRFESDFPDFSTTADTSAHPFTVSITYNEIRGERVTQRVVLSSGDYSLAFERKDTRLHAELKIGSAIAMFELVLPANRNEYILSHAWGFSRLIAGLREACVGNETTSHPLEARLVQSDFENTDQLRVVLTAFENTFDRALRKAMWSISPSAPIRSEPRRVYTVSAAQPGLDDSDRIPQTLNRLKQYDPAVWGQVHKGLKEFGVQAGLYDDIDVRSLRGKRGPGPFEIIVTRGGVEANLTDVGYGVSQVIPFIAEILIDNCFESRNDLTKLYYVQQPETHLHPASQAALGTFFYNFSKTKNRRVILETHSDYLIDRVRQHIRADKDGAEDRSVLLFFENKNGSSKAHTIEFDRQGNVQNAPTGYRDFFLREELRNLGVIGPEKA